MPAEKSLLNHYATGLKTFVLCNDRCPPTSGVGDRECKCSRTMGRESGIKYRVLPNVDVFSAERYTSLILVPAYSSLLREPTNRKKTSPKEQADFPSVERLYNQIRWKRGRDPALLSSLMNLVWIESSRRCHFQRCRQITSHDGLVSTHD